MGPFTLMLLLHGTAVQASQDSNVDWQWDPNTPICTLSQQSSSSGERIELTRTPGNDETELMVTLHSHAKLRQGKFRDGRISLFPGGGTVADVSAGMYSEKRVYAVTYDPTFIQRLSKASALEISHEKLSSVRVSVRSAAAATAALRECEDRKMRDWGIDPIAWRGLKARPIPLKPVRRRFSDLDYPAAALAAGVETDAIIRLDVRSDGSVEKCRSLNAGRYKGFEDAACAVLRGAQFQPAVDSAGNTVSAPVLFNVRFRVAR